MIFRDEDVALARQRAKYLPADWGWDEFQSWVRHPETERVLREKYGENWTLNQAMDELATPAIPKKDRQRARVRENKPEPEETELPQIDKKVVEVEFNKRLGEILATTTDIQPWDLAQLTVMIKSDILAEKYLGMLETETKNVTINALIAGIEKLSKRSSDIQKILRIDRSTRQADADKLTDADKSEEIIHDAGTFVLKNSLRIEHCGVLVGFLYDAYLELPFRLEFTCSECNERFVVDHVPTAEQIAGATEPSWVAPEEASYETGVSDEDHLPSPE